MLGLLVLLALSASKETRVLVNDLTPSAGISKEMAESLTAQLALGIDGLGAFKTITMRDVAQMVAAEEGRQAAGCTANAACLAEIGGAVGAQYVVSGSVMLFGQSYLCQLQLLNTKIAAVENRVSREYQGGPVGLIEDMRTAAHVLMRDLLALRSGSASIAVAEEGATIKVDGAIVGVSPLPPLSLAGGVHTVIVEKTGFIVELRDIQVPTGGRAELRVSLRPSEEFLASYRHAATQVRIAAWSAGGGGIAALGVGAALFAAASVRNSAYNRDVAVYNASLRRAPEAAAALGARARDIATLDAACIAVGSLGLAALAAGIILYVTGHDPARYQMRLEPRLSIRPSGGAVGAELRY